MAKYQYFTVNNNKEFHSFTNILLSMGKGNAYFTFKICPITSKQSN